MTAGGVALQQPAGRTPDGLAFITALGIGQICSWGSLYYSFPLIAEAMGADLGWSKPEIYGAATLGLALSGLAAYPVGMAIDRGHGRIVMGVGSIIAGLLLLAWSQASSLVLFYAAFAGIGCLQAATLYEPAFAVVAKRVGVDNARRGITALTLWGGFASTVFIPLVQILLDQFGWRGALVALGAINIVVCGGLYLAAIRPELDAAPSHRSASHCEQPAEDHIMTWAMRTPVFWALALFSIAYAATFSAFTFHLYPLLLERGLDTASVVAAMTIIGPAQVAGRIAIWVFAPFASVRRIGSFAVAAFPLVFLTIALLPPTFLVMAGVAALYGGANGIMTIVRGMAVPEMLTPRAYGTINGALTAPSLVAKALAPVGAAALWATTGSYAAVLVAMLIGALVLAGGFWAAALMRLNQFRPTLPDGE